MVTNKIMDSCGPMVCGSDEDTLIVISGIPGVGKTSRVRVVADQIAFRVGFNKPVFFMDTDMFGFRIQGKFYVNVEEVSRLIALVRNHGVRVFVIGGTCANFGGLLSELSTVDRKVLVELQRSPEAILSVVMARQSEDDVESASHSDVYADDSVPDTLGSMRAWITDFHEIAVKQSNRHGYEHVVIDIPDDDGSVFSSSTGRGTATVRSVRRSIDGPDELVAPDTETGVYAGFTVVMREDADKIPIKPQTFNLFSNVQNGRYHRFPLNLESLRLVRAILSRDDL